MGKLTISMAIFNSKLLVYQRVSGRYSQINLSPEKNFPEILWMVAKSCTSWQLVALGNYETVTMGYGINMDIPSTGAGFLPSTAQCFFLFCLGTAPAVAFRGCECHTTHGNADCAELRLGMTQFQPLTVVNWSEMVRIFWNTFFRRVLLIFSCAELTNGPDFGEFFQGDCGAVLLRIIQISSCADMGCDGPMEAGMKQSSSFFLFYSCCQAVKHSDCLGTTDLFSAQQKQGFSDMFSITLMEMTHVT